MTWTHPGCVPWGLDAQPARTSHHQSTGIIIVSCTMYTRRCPYICASEFIRLNQVHPVLILRVCWGRWGVMRMEGLVLTVGRTASLLCVCFRAYIHFILQMRPRLPPSFPSFLHPLLPLQPPVALSFLKFFQMQSALRKKRGIAESLECLWAMRQGALTFIEVMPNLSSRPHRFAFPSSSCLSRRVAPTRTPLWGSPETCRATVGQPACTAVHRREFPNPSPQGEGRGGKRGAHWCMVHGGRWMGSEDVRHVRMLYLLHGAFLCSHFV